MNTQNRLSWRFVFGRKEFTMFFVLIGMVLISAIISPNFRSIENIVNLFNQNAIIGAMAVGMAFVLITGAFDLSVSSTVALTGIVATMLMKQYGIAIGIIGGLLVGALVGLANGLLITKININAFVATLGTMTIGRGIVFIVTNGFPVMGVPSELNFIGMGEVGPFPVAATIWIILAVCMYLIMRFTAFGQYVYAVGGNDNAAWLSGVDVALIKIICFVVCGIFASIGGLILISRVMIATADAANGYELTTIASCIVGGISIDGGRGSVLSSIIGVLILGLILNMLQLTGISSFWQSAVTGVIILGAVGIDSFSKSKRN